MGLIAFRLLIAYFSSLLHICLFFNSANSSTDSHYVFYMVLRIIQTSLVLHPTMFLSGTVSVRRTTAIEREGRKRESMSNVQSAVA